MTRTGIDYDDVKQASVKLLSQGIAPSVQKIREVLGTGSNTTIAEHLKVWREDYAKKSIHHLPASLPKELISSLEVLWQTAMEQAQNQLSHYKETLDAEQEKIREAQHDSEKRQASLQEQITELSDRLSCETDKNQQLNIELALSSDRLTQQEQTLIDQKQQYEERLKRTYAEKDDLLANQNQVQQKMHQLQQKLAEQTATYQQESLKRHELHEQSEQRWMQLIDRARQETIDQRKKYEKTITFLEEKNKSLTDTVSKSQQLFHDKSIKLAAALQQLNQLQKTTSVSKIVTNSPRKTLKKSQINQE